MIDANLRVAIDEFQQRMTTQYSCFKPHGHLRWVWREVFEIGMVKTRINAWVAEAGSRRGSVLLGRSPGGADDVDGFWKETLLGCSERRRFRELASSPIRPPSDPHRLLS